MSTYHSASGRHCGSVGALTESRTMSLIHRLLRGLKRLLGLICHAFLLFLLIGLCLALPPVGLVVIAWVLVTRR